MKRRLWSVLSGRRPVAVVAADHPEEARRIVSALEQFHDLPAEEGGGYGLAPCSGRKASRTMSMARDLGVEQSFLACVRDGMFLSVIGSLSADTR